MTLLFLLIVAVALISVVSSVNRRRRHALAVEQARLGEEARRGGEAAGTDPFVGASPFDMLPFGGLLESLMSGMGARSFRYDEETGGWVEISDEIPEPHPAPAREPADGNPLEVMEDRTHHVKAKVGQKLLPGRYSQENGKAPFPGLPSSGGKI